MFPDMVSSMNLDLLERLIKAHGLAGFEDDVITIFARELENCTDRIEIDDLGNVYGFKKGTGELTLMLQAHMDEIGLIVKYIEEDGFVRVEKMGDLLDYIFPGSRVVLGGKKGPLEGIVGIVAAHMVGGQTWGGEERRVSPGVEDQFIDIGASSRDEAVEMGVEIGTPVTFFSEPVRLGEHLIAGKSMDDRALLAVIVEVMKRLKSRKHGCRVVAVGTVEEEPGCRGVRVAAERLRPDLALALDITIAGDLPGSDFRKAPISLGKGPGIKVMDVDVPHTGLITHRPLREFVIETSEKLGIPIQKEVFGSGITTDGSGIQWSGTGVPTMVLSIPARYAHSAVETLHLADMELLVELLVEIITTFPDDFDFRRVII